MKVLRTILFMLVPFSLYACVMVDSVGRDHVPKEAATAPRVYYAGVSGLKMFSQRSASGSPIAELPLHAKVLRYKLERGFAYVKVAKTGQVGWVRNCDLIWRKRSAKKVTPKKEPPAQQNGNIVLENESDVNHDPNSETERRDASMFDAF